eukprot:scaffold14598_cov31-Tisochrysis_lutea.AAC.1
MVHLLRRNARPYQVLLAATASENYHTVTVNGQWSTFLDGTARDLAPCLVPRGRVGPGWASWRARARLGVRECGCRCRERRRSWGHRVCISGSAGENVECRMSESAGM